MKTAKKCQKTAVLFGCGFLKKTMVFGFKTDRALVYCICLLSLAVMKALKFLLQLVILYMH